MSKEYYWWGLDDSTFKGILYDSISTYFLNDHPYENWDEFSKADPHMAYAYQTSIRFDTLEQQFVDLRVIPQMLGVEDIPLKSSVQDINRYEWLKSIVDLTLFRFSSIRDIAFHFVNEILELEIPDNKLNIKHLNKLLKEKHSKILKNLKIINGIGSHLRLERNERVHKGFSNLHTEDDLMFKNMSWIELYESKINGYDLIKVYENSREKIYNIVVKEVEEAMNACLELVEQLYIHYRDRYDSLSKNSKSGVSYHFHNYHRKK